GLWATVHSERWGIRHGTAEHGDELVFLIQGWLRVEGCCNPGLWRGGERCPKKSLRGRREDGLRRGSDRHRRDKTIAPPMHRLDKLRVLGRVAQSGPKLPDAIAHHRLTDRRGAPDSVEQGVLGGHLARMGHEILQHSKRLGPQRYGL